MRTKIVRAGNSRAVILPAAVVASQGWDPGDEMDLEEIASGVLIRPVPRRSFVSSAKRVIRDHDVILRELAKR